MPPVTATEGRGEGEARGPMPPPGDKPVTNAPVPEAADDELPGLGLGLGLPPGFPPIGIEPAAPAAAGEALEG